MIPFGHEFRRRYYSSMSSEIIPVNHGSFGVTPDPVFAAYSEVMRQDFAFPDEFCKYGILENYERSLKALGEFLKCDYRRLALIENATQGVNTFLRSWKFNPGDVFVIPSTTYGACANTVRFLELQAGIEVKVVRLTYPMSDDEVVALFEQEFKDTRVTMAMFDTVASMPGVAMPYQRLTALCKDHGVVSVIDGAHGVGLIPLNLGDLAPDFFVSNCHKWLGVPRGCAVMYVDPKHWEGLHSFPVSHSFLPDFSRLSEAQRQNRLVDQFGFIGTLNFSSYGSIPAALAFRQNECGGEENIRAYCYDLAREAGQFLASKWGTSVLENDASSLSTAMVNVEVPLHEAGLTSQQVDANYGSIFDAVGREMLYKDGTWVPFLIHNDKCYARFSCMVYNELSDYDKASDSLMRALREISKLVDENRLASHLAVVPGQGNQV
ncbi:hypothetical protein DICA1_E27138 [Diutina catenulata]